MNEHVDNYFVGVTYQIIPKKKTLLTVNFHVLIVIQIQLIYVALFGLVYEDYLSFFLFPQISS